jgi:DUF4097 and DUF4098 domain-containing protein YvlB
MKHKWIIAGALVTVLLLICMAAVVIMFFSLNQAQMSGGDVDWRVFQNDLFSAEEDQEWSFTADGATELVLDSRFGDVEVTGGQGNEIIVKAHKTAWDSSQARADAAVKEMPIEVKQEGNKITVNYLPPLQGTVIGSSRTNTVDFSIQVPENTSVQATVKFGEVTLTDVSGEANLDTQFGGVTVSGLKGGLQANANNGDVRAQRIQAGQQDIKLESNFGDLNLEQASAANVDAQTSNGKVTFNDVEASGYAKLSSQFGDIQFMKGRAASLDAGNDNGTVILEEIVLEGALTAHSRFGDVTVRQVTATGYTLTSGNGDISLSGAQGAVKANTEFGRITIREAQNVTLDLEAKSGGIDFRGSLGDGPHILKSEFGDVRMALPKDSALNFDIKTEFGKLKSDFQVTISGEVDEKHWVGTINNGGASLQIQVNNGNITLEMISQEQ